MNWGKVERNESLYLNLSGRSMASNRVNYIGSYLCGQWGLVHHYRPQSDKFHDIIIRPVGFELRVEWSFVHSPYNSEEVLVVVRPGFVCWLVGLLVC